MKKNCIFDDFDIDYETGEKIYTKFKIVLKLKKQNVNKTCKNCYKKLKK